MERQIFLKKTQKRKKKLETLKINNPELYLQKTQLKEPETQFQQLLNNFAKLMQNFTQLIAAKKKQKEEDKIPSTPEFDQSQKEEDLDDQKIDSSEKERVNQKNQQTIEKKHLPVNKIIQNNQQIQLQPKSQQISQQHDKIQYEDSSKKENQIFTNNKQPSYLQQSLAYSQSKQGSVLQRFDQQQKNSRIPGSSTLQCNYQDEYSSGELESYDDVEPLQQNKSKQQQNQSQDDYPDDFFDEPNDKFQQNLSNFFFYKPKTQVPVPDQIDFDDEIEDLLL